jgi:hypothetical protein
MKHFKLILLPLIFILFSCSSDNDDTTQMARLELTILDENNLPIENATVNIYTSSEDSYNGINVSQSLITDSNGKVLFEDLEQIVYYWEIFDNCYNFTYGNTINPLLGNSLNTFTSNTYGASGFLNVNNVTDYDYNINLIGPQNRSFIINANSTYSVDNLPNGNYTIERTRINPTSAVLQNDFEITCGATIEFTFSY